MTNRTVYLVRHGQRLDAIDKNWYQAHDANKYDPPLSEQGFQQAAKVGYALRDEPIDVIVSSPYLRALQTAQTIAKSLDMRFIVDEGMGEWLGKAMIPREPNITPPADRIACFANMDLSHESKILPQYPETVPQVFERYKKAMAHLLTQYDGNLLIVGHGRVVTGTSHVLVGKPERHFKYGLACITELVQAGTGWDIVRNGDTSHLKTEIQPETYYV